MHFEMDFFRPRVKYSEYSFMFYFRKNAEMTVYILHDKSENSAWKIRELFTISQI